MRRIAQSFWVIFIIAFIVRVGWIIRLMHAGIPEQFNPFTGSEIGYIAINLAAGRGFSFPFGVGSSPSAWVCPIVPAIYAAFLKVAGDQVLASWLIFLSNAIASSFTAASFGLIARRVAASRSGLFAPWLFSALAIFTIWPEEIYYVATPWYWVWQGAALAVFVLAAMRWWDRRDSASAILVGIAGGVIALINVTPLPIVAFAMLFPAVRRAKGQPALRATALAAAAFALMVTPWLVRHALTFRAIVPLRANAGFELFQSNNPTENLRQTGLAPHPMTDRLELQRYTELGEVAYCREALSRALAYIRENPWQTVRRTAARIYICWLTDLTDHWTPPHRQKWWHLSLTVIAGYLSGILLTFCSLGIVVWAAVSGRFRLLPYWPLVAAILLLLPLPHYFTFADYQYTTILRMWLGFTAILMLALRVVPLPRGRGSVAVRPLNVAMLPSRDRNTTVS